MSAADVCRGTSASPKLAQGVLAQIRQRTVGDLRFLLAYDRMRSELTKTAAGTSGSMLNLSINKLCELRAPFPPIDLQNRFVALVWRNLDAKVQHQSANE